MKFKTKDIKKIEIFAPGTAGERAIRVETQEGEVEILNEDQYPEVEIKESN